MLETEKKGNYRMKWYAVMMDDEDIDWGTGSYNKNEALKMLHRMEADHIDIVEDNDDPICIGVVLSCGVEVYC